MEPNSKSDTLDHVVYDSLKEDLYKKQHVDAVISFYNDITEKVEYTASCHRIAMAAKSKLLHRLLASHDGPDDEKVHVILVDSIDRGKAERLIEQMYDPDKTDKDIALWDSEGVEEEEDDEDMDFMIEPETILQADDIKKEPVESDPLDDSVESAVCVAPGKYIYKPVAKYRWDCERPERKKTPQAQEVLQRMDASEKGDFRAVDGSMDKVFCRLCEKTLKLSTTGVIRQHCNTATHRKRKQWLKQMAETNLMADNIKKEKIEVSSEDELGHFIKNSYVFNLKSKQNGTKKVKTLEEVLLDVNILENFALKTVANSKDKIYCQICAITLTVNRPIDVKAHCKTAEHIMKKDGTTTYSNQQMYEKMITQLVKGPQKAPWQEPHRYGIRGKRKTLQDTLDKLNIQENGALRAVEGAQDKVFCRYCEKTLTIGNLSDIKRHCNSSKHLKGKISPDSRANNMQGDPLGPESEYLFNDELCDELSPASHNSRPYKRKTFEEVIEEFNVHEDGAFSIVGDSKDEVQCWPCERTFKVQQLANLKQHCRGKKHIMGREAKKKADTGESKRKQTMLCNEEDETDTSLDASVEQRAPKTSFIKPRTLGDVLIEVNADENGALQVVENEKDKIFCQTCDQTLTIWQMSDIRRHCKLTKHRKNKEKGQEKSCSEDGKRFEAISKEGPNICPYCKHGFSLSALCKQHILKVHDVEVKGMSLKRFCESVSKGVEVIEKSAKRPKLS